MKQSNELPLIAREDVVLKDHLRSFDILLQTSELLHRAM